MRSAARRCATRTSSANRIPAVWRRGLAPALLLSITWLSGCATSRTPLPALSRSDRVLLPDAAALRQADALAHFGSALVAADLAGGGDERVASHLAAAALLDAGNPEVVLAAASAALFKNCPDEVLSMLNRALAAHPDDSRLHAMLGVTLHVAGRDRAAAREFSWLIQRHPDDADGYVRLASLRLSQNRFNDAAEVLVGGLRRPEREAGLWRYADTLVRTLLDSGQPEAALRVLAELRAGQPGKPVWLLLAASAEGALGHRGAAENLIAEARHGAPQDAEVLFESGVAYTVLALPDKAEACFAAAMQREPPREDFFARRAQLFFNAGDVANGLRLLEDGIRRMPGSLDLPYFLGQALTKFQQPAAAVRIFANLEPRVIEAIQRNMLAPEFFFAYGVALELLGRNHEAEERFEAAIRLNPDFAEALNYLAYMWAEKGVHLDRAATYVRRALAEDPDNGAYLDTLGWVQYRQGDYAAAKTTLRRAVALEGEDATVLEHFGDVLDKLGDPGAICAWKQSYQLGAEHPTLLEGKLRAKGVKIESVRPVKMSER